MVSLKQNTICQDTLKFGIMQKIDFSSRGQDIAVISLKGTCYAHFQHQI